MVDVEVRFASHEDLQTHYCCKHQTVAQLTSSRRLRQLVHGDDDFEGRIVGACSVHLELI